MASDLQDFEHMFFYDFRHFSFCHGFKLLEMRVTFDLTGIGGVLCKILAYGCNFIKKDISKFFRQNLWTLIG